MLVRLDPPSGFLERSSMLSMRTWEHERTLEPAAGGGCVRAATGCASSPGSRFPAACCCRSTGRSSGTATAGSGATSGAT